MGEDENAHPAHALKFYASLKDRAHADNIVLLGYKPEDDHFCFLRDDNAQLVAHEIAKLLCFLEKTIGLPGIGKNYG